MHHQQPQQVQHHRSHQPLLVAAHIAHQGPAQVQAPGHGQKQGRQLEDPVGQRPRAVIP